MLKPAAASHRPSPWFIIVSGCWTFPGGNKLFDGDLKVAIDGPTAQNSIESGNHVEHEKTEHGIVRILTCFSWMQSFTVHL